MECRHTHIRLFVEDIEKAKVLAKEMGLPWQTWLRLLIHEAIKDVQKEKAVK